MKVEVRQNPIGTVLGDLNHKLSNDMLRLIYNYLELTDNIEEISYTERVSSILSVVSRIVVTIETLTKIPEGVSETYLKTLRKLERGW